MMHDESAYSVSNKRARRAAELRKNMQSLDWCHVEIARLERILTEKIELSHRLEVENAQLTQLLGQAQAGMELADLIKRMIA